MSTAVVRGGTDSWVASGTPSANHRGGKSLHVRSGAETQYAYAYFKNPAPRGATILSATLRFYGRSTGWGAQTMRVRRISVSWKSGRINWDNRPATTGTDVDVTQTNPEDGTEWAFDVTAQIQTITDGAANYGFRLETTTSADSRAFYALNASRNRPTLTVTWSDAPDAPTSLSPSGGRAVSVSHPTLRFDYTDVSGNDELGAVQVQIDPLSDFGTPDFDSGEVLTGSPELDLVDTAYTGLSAGASTFWRVRVRDSAGHWSEWSDPAEFSRVAKGTVAIVNPAADPNDFVTEWTPPIIWSVSGATQVGFRVIVFRVTSAGKLAPLHDTGRVDGADDSYTLPKRILTDQTATYRVVIHVWDTVSREATPGDVPYIWASRDFTFSDVVGVIPVSGLTVAQDSPRPWMVLSWTLATAPDSYAVVRDGEVVDALLDPADLLVSGTSYEYIDKAADPDSEHTWEVQAVVNGETSENNPTVVDTFESTGIWLADLTDNRIVYIGGDEPGDFRMGEIGETYEPINGDAVIRITQAIRGLEGSISGILRDRNGETAEHWRGELEEIKRHPGRELLLTFPDLALPVVVANIKIAPTPSFYKADRDVSFDFWATRGFPGGVFL